jgi:hypothetical protein
MMNCEQTNSFLDDYLDGFLDEAQRQELEAHLATCQECQMDLDNRMAVLKSLRALPVPRPSPGFEERVLRNARHGNRKHVGFSAGFGSAVAAGLLVWFAIGFWYPSDRPEHNALSVIVMQVEQPREVSLAFNVPHAIREVTFRIELPEGVEIEGYPEQRELVWMDQLPKGRNVMNLNLVARQGVNGELLARIQHDDKEQVFHVPVRASMNGVGVTLSFEQNTISI